MWTGLFTALELVLSWLWEGFAFEHRGYRHDAYGTFARQLEYANIRRIYLQQGGAALPLLIHDLNGCILPRAICTGVISAAHSISDLIAWLAMCLDLLVLGVGTGLLFWQINTRGRDTFKAVFRPTCTLIRLLGFNRVVANVLAFLLMLAVLDRQVRGRGSKHG